MAGGIRIVRDNRRQVRDQLHKACAQALTDAGNELLQKASQGVPKDESILEGSGDVSVDVAKLRVQVGYGGEASAYAVKQHEDTTLSHPGGRRAKWLEMAFKENASRVGGWLAETIRGLMR